MPAPPDGPRPVTRGWKSFEEGDLWGFKDAKGKVVIAPRYDVVQEFTGGGIACVVDGKDGWVCIDGNGAPLVRPYIVDNGPDDFSGGLARFVEAGKVGFFDDAGNKKIPARFSFAQPFSGDRAAFCDGCTKQCDGEHCSMVGGKWGLIDPTGKQVVAATFDEIDPFVGGYAHAVKDGKEVNLDRNGVVSVAKPSKLRKGG